MFAISENRKYVEVRVDNELELWFLWYITDEDTIIITKTFRDIKSKSGRERKPVYIGIKPIDKYLDVHSNSLRIHGVIVKTSDEKIAPRGKHHSITISLGSTIKLERDKPLDSSMIELLKTIITDTFHKHSYPLIVISDEEVLYVRFYGTSYKVVLHEYYDLDETNSIEESLHRILKQIANDTKNDDTIIIATQPTLRNTISKVLSSAVGTNSKKLVFVDIFSSGIAGLHEMLKNTNVLASLGLHEEAEAQHTIDKFFQMLKRGEEVYNGDIVTPDLLDSIRMATIVVTYTYLMRKPEIFSKIVEKTLKGLFKVIILRRKSPQFDLIESLGGIIIVPGK